MSAPPARSTEGRSSHAELRRLHPLSVVSLPAAILAAALFFSSLYSPILSFAVIAASAIGLVGVLRQKRKYKGMVLCIIALVIGVCLLVPSIVRGVELAPAPRALASRG